MPIFKTSHGLITVDNWAYQLQGNGGQPLDVSSFAFSAHDLVVIDSTADGTDATRFSSDQINAITSKPGGAVAVSYISIGEASDFRDYWSTSWTTTGKATGTLTAAAPGWLGPVNPNWPESRKVRYWDSGWQSIMFNSSKTGDLDKIVAQGFDAAYLDIVDAYYFWGAEAKPAQKRAGDPMSEQDAAQRMIDFVVAMTAHARETNPDFLLIPQNAPFIIDALADNDPLRKAKYLDAIGGIGVEDIYLRDGDQPENNGFKPDEDAIAVLKRDFLAEGKPVFAVDYVTDILLMGKFIQRALADGFIPFVAKDRDLNVLTAPVLRAEGADDSDSILAGTVAADSIDGKAGADTLFGFGGADSLIGGAGDDILVGGLGGDFLTGGDGGDAFIFSRLQESKRGARDVIVDFQRGQDTINPRRIDANSDDSGNQAFTWIGKDGFHQVPGELRFAQKSFGLVILGDVNGDGAADLRIALGGLSKVGAADFLL
jgi:uncharacterized protein (TIGR01370 family)